MSAILSAGYNVDFIDAEAIDTVGLGTHQILVLPPTDRIPLETLQEDRGLHGRRRQSDLGRPSAVDRSRRQDTPELTSLSKRLFDPAKSTLVPNEAALPTALNQAAKPDFQLPADDTAARTQLGFIRRRLPTADIYFVINTSNEALDTTASFATAHKSGEAWDPDSTAAAPATAESLPIHLAPYESRVFVFSDSRPATKPAAHDTAGALIADINTPWKVSFPGIHKTIDESALADWIADPSTLHYSGEAVYSNDVTLASVPTGPVFLEVAGGKPLPGAPNSPAEHAPLGPDGLPDPRVTRPGPGMHAYYDPPIREAALVTINGQPAGALWHPPYRLDVTRLLKTGTNHIEITVYNTALNAWSALPKHDYGPLIAKYGDRFQMQDLDKVVPISSGLLGKVRLISEVQ